MTRGLSAGVFALALLSCQTVVVSPTPTASPSSPPTASPTVPPTPTARPLPSLPLARTLSEADAQQAVGAAVREILAALKNRDSAVIARAAHPTKGVRFTMSSYVRPADDVTLTAAQLANAFADPTLRRWGTTDGRGDPVVLTFAEYTSQYLYARDFAASSQTAYNRTIGQGNSTDNTAVIYPDAILFEAFDPGPDPAMRDTRCQSLRLLFEREQSRWYLVAVVHAHWTI